MHFELAYGKGRLGLDLPGSAAVTVVEPTYLPGLPDPVAAVRAALAAPIAALAAPVAAQPLAELARPGMRVGLIFSDITRATPHEVILPPILDALAQAGVPREDITLFEALGTHRRNSEAELAGMLGEELARTFRIVQNDAFDPATQAYAGRSSRGHEIWLNREMLECDLRILTGFIEPHFFAGFSGGGKAIMPGMAGLRTVLGNHDAGMISHPNATWGVTEGNPIWEEVVEVALAAGPLFLVNVTMNRDRQVTGVFAGDLLPAHAAGCEFARRTAMTPVPHPFDIVITTNSGYPLDQNLYQAVKGMSAAAQIVKPGGAIIIAAECADGIPDHGKYGELLRGAESPAALLETINQPGFLEQDQWEAQIHAQILLKAEVYVRTDNLTRAQIESALLKPCVRIEDTVAGLLARYDKASAADRGFALADRGSETSATDRGSAASICVLPEGPQTIPFVGIRTQER